MAAELTAFSNFDPETVRRMMATQGAGSAAPQPEGEAPLSALRDFEERIKILNEFMRQGEYTPENVSLQRLAVPDEDQKERKPWVKKAALAGDVISNILTILGNRKEEKKARRAGARGYRPDYRRPPGAPIQTGMRQRDLERRGRVQDIEQKNVSIANQEAIANAGAQSAAAGKAASMRSAMGGALAAALFRDLNTNDPAQVEALKWKLEQIEKLPEDQRGIAMLSLITSSSPFSSASGGIPRNETLEQRIERIKRETIAREEGRNAVDPYGGTWNKLYISYQRDMGYSPQEAQAAADRDIEMMKIARRNQEQSKGELTSRPKQPIPPELETPIKNLTVALGQYPDPADQRELLERFKEQFGVDPLLYVDQVAPQAP